MNVTEKETAVLLASYFSEYQDSLGEDTIGFEVWSNQLWPGKGILQDVSPAQIGGVMSSLSQKGLVDVDYSDDPDMKGSLVALTSDGYNVIKDLI